LRSILLPEDTFVSPQAQRRNDVFRHIGKRNLVGVIAVLVAVVAGASAYAYTASIGVSDHNAGAGSAVVSGYTVTGPTNYTFSADGTTIVGVDFQLDNAATDVAAALSAAAPVHNDWVDCGASTGGSNDVSCTFTTPVADASGLQLSVAAVSTGTVTIAP
jgi:hypothetical protein